MQLWLDGDACPKAIKDVLFRAAHRRQCLLTVVANHFFPTLPSPYIKKIQVSAGFDMADNKIVELLEPGDLVITADIPLADAVVSKGGIALNPRGELYTTHNIKQHLALRNLNDSLRSGGLISGGPPKFSPREIQNFAKALDKFLMQAKK